jgi:hypothetical protein
MSMALECISQTVCTFTKYHLWELGSTGSSIICAGSRVHVSNEQNKRARQEGFDAVGHPGCLILLPICGNWEALTQACTARRDTVIGARGDEWLERVHIVGSGLTWDGSPSEREARQKHLGVGDAKERQRAQRDRHRETGEHLLYKHVVCATHQNKYTGSSASCTASLYASSRARFRCVYARTVHS